MQNRELEEQLQNVADECISLKDKREKLEDDLKHERATQRDLRDVVRQLEEDLMVKSQDEATLLTVGQLFLSALSQIGFVASVFVGWCFH